MAINFPDSPTAGQVFTSGSTSWTWDGTKWGLNTTTAVSNDSMPVGSILWYANTTSAPTGWIAADGSAVSRTTYSTLFSTIGTTYGAGNGSTTFNVPSVAATTGKYYIRYTTAVGTVTTTSLATSPVGTMIDWPITSSYPTGWLRADGSAVNRTSYNDLFTLIGTTYGTGDGSTTFNLPNMVQAGSGSPVTIIKASLGGTVEPSTVAHAGSHTEGGSDVISVTLNQVPSYQSMRNKIINGAFSVDQRNSGASQTITAGAALAYTVDRWYAYCTGANVTTQRVAGSAPFQYYYRLTGLASNTGVGVGTRLEATDTFFLAGTTATLSAYIASSSLTSVTWAAYYANTADTFGTLASPTRTQIATGSFTVSSTLSRKSVQISVPAAATTGIEIVFTGGALLGSQTLTFAGVQLEQGSVATPFEFEPYETTLRKCQRYFVRWGGVAFYMPGQCNTATRSYFMPPYAMRALPTNYDYSTIVVNDSNVAPTVGAVTISSFGGSSFAFYVDTGAGGLTAGRAAMLQGTATGSYIWFSTEL